MKFADNVSKDNDTFGGGAKPPCTGLTPDALPEVQTPVLAEDSDTGVSTRNPPPSPFLLSPPPRRRTHHQTTTYCSRLPNRKS